MGEITLVDTAVSDTVKPLSSGALVPHGVVTVTFLVPGVALPAMEILVSIQVSLNTPKLLTVIPAPKLTAVAPVK